MQQFASDHRVVLDVLSKTARVTAFFWIMKVLATTLGETAGDFVSMTLDLGYYAGLTITFAALVVILALVSGLRLASCEMLLIGRFTAAKSAGDRFGRWPGRPRRRRRCLML